MVIVGLLLVAASVGVAADLVTQNTATIHVAAFGNGYSVTPGWLFVIGGATAAAGMLGLAVMLRGIAAARRRRAMLHESLGAAEGLKAERDRLAAALDAERIARDQPERRPSSVRVPSLRVGAPTAEALATSQSRGH
jgi:hypothetical protein